jgi:uncharacterized protein
MEKLIRSIVTAMVDLPDEVLVNCVAGGNGVSIYEVKVAKTDTGKIIGKQGRNAEAMRTIINAVSTKNRRRSILEILEGG